MQKSSLNVKLTPCSIIFQIGFLFLFLFLFLILILILILILFIICK